jgi:RHS repeat-associated protein
MNKLIYILLLCLAVVCHANVDDVVPGPARNESVTEKYLLPSWVNMDGANESAFASGGVTEIQLNEDYHISYMGETYSSLSVYNNGRIAFGKYSADLNLLNHPFIQPINRNGSLGGFFKWKYFGGKKLTPAEVNYVALEFGRFTVDSHEYSLQVLIYKDGEVQVQLWQYPDQKAHNSYVNYNYDWAKPSIFNGYAWQSLDEAYPKTMSIVENGQVREGWVAKGFGYYNNDIWQDGDISVAAVYRDDENQQLVYDMGANPRAGALVAYDFSREHPVVGGIKLVSVNYNLSAVPALQPDFRIYNWYFDNVKVITSDDKTTLAGYQYFYIDGTQPKLKRGCQAGGDVNLSSAINVSYTLNTNYFCKAWEELSEGVGVTSPYIENDAVRFHPAPAFKFQWKDNSYATMRFNSIVYSLNQRPMVRFLPPKPEFYLATSTNVGGRILVENLEGSSPYWLFKGQKVKAEIRATVGSVIKSVKLNGVDVYRYNETLKEGSLLTESELGNYVGIRQYFKEIGYNLAERISFDVDETVMSMILEVEFAPCNGRRLDPVTPQMVKTTNYLDPETMTGARRNASAVIKGSFGETVQKQDSLIAVDNLGNPIEHNYVVSAYYTDDYQQKNYDPSDFVHVANDFEYLDMACYECVKKANAYYDGTDAFDQPDAEGYAYVQYEKRYGNTEGSNGTSYGIADASFDKIPEQAESWTIPVYSDNEFIVKEHLNKDDIKPYYRNQHSKSGVAKYSLTVSRDAEGRFSQKIVDSKGLLKSTWRMVGDKEYIVKYDYDEFDRLKKITPNGNSKLAVTYSYNDKGQVVETKDPDRGITKTAYDKYGRVRFIQNAAQKARNRFTAKIYDDLGREIAVVEVLQKQSFSKPDDVLDPGNYIPYNRTLYGMPTAQILRDYGLNVDAALVSSILNNMNNIRDKDVGAIFAYDADGNLAVAKMSSYDRIGQKNRQWIIYTMDGVPAVEQTFEYNQANELVYSSFGEWNVSESRFTKRAERYRSYDASGRLLKIEDENRKALATYEYTKNGNVKSKSYYDKGNLVYTKTILRDVHGRPTEIIYKNSVDATLYSDKISSYVNPFVGRIAEASHEWNNLDGLGNVVRSGKYSYDGDGRLTQVEGSLPSLYRYEGAEGQMTYKQEGANTVETSYSDERYRPAGFSVNGENPNADVEYFKYDAAGNVWYDKRARVVYRLNAGGLPDVAYVLSEGRAEPTLAQVNDSKKPLTDVDETMRMAYDESGDRIWTSFKGAGIDEEFATMPGVGEYHVQHVVGNDNFTLIRMDLVAGGFRDMESDVAYFPVTDAQGNIRGYATTTGLQSAYDYYAYGTTDEIMRGPSDDNKRWQGKEYDEPIKKLYFGARYFDPFFGLWLTPDPASQFTNPYTYGGDPVNYVDPNGEFVHIVVGAVVGAVVGTVQGIVSCTAPGGGSCGKSVGVGFVGGAAVGAAAAATGGAASGAIGGLGGAIIGGAAGGAVSGAGNYATQNLANGTDMSWDGAWNSTWKGALSGAVSGGVGHGLGSLGEAFGGSWKNPLTWLGNVPVLNQATSSSLGSMAVAAVDGEDLGSAAVSGFFSGMASSMISSGLSLAALHIAYNLGGIDAVNKLFSGNDGYWTDEFHSVMDAEAVPGTVTGSSAEGWGIAISIISGGGPVSHVRGSDVDGRVVDNNGGGVQQYWDKSNTGNRNYRRLTYVTKRYVGQQSPTATTSALKGRGAVRIYEGISGYRRAGLCTGATHMINPGYKGGAPNNLISWQYSRPYITMAW